MGLKIFGVGGIDQKSNDLLRDPTNLRGAKNIRASLNGEYIKRPGTDNDPDFENDVFNDVHFIKSLGEYFYWDGTDYVVYKDGVKRTPSTRFKGIPTGEITDLSLDEYLNTAIFTHNSSNSLGVVSYDGHAIYRAGLPTPMTTSVDSGDGFMLTFYEFMDAKGNLYYGPSTITSGISKVSNTITFNTLKDTGFFDAYLKVTISTTPIVLNETSRVLPYNSASADVLAIGAKVAIRSRGTTITISDPTNPNRDFSDVFLILEVESFTGSAITFTAASFKKLEISIGLTLGSPVDANIHGCTVLRVLFSNNETTGYTTNPSSSLNGQLVDNSTATNSGTYSYVTDRDVLLSSFYDITTSKLRPPSCTSLLVYGYQLVCGGAFSFWDFQNNQTIYSGNDDLVIYSDVSTGDLATSFSEINRQLIGQTYDGRIIGLSRVKDSLIVFKNRSAFAMDGILIPGQYTLRKIETNQIGCQSLKSILPMDLAVMFQGQDGLYVINGYKCEKITNTLDPFFTTIDPLLTRSVMNNSDDQYIFWTDMGIVVFDYHYEQWYLWDGISGQNGLTVDNERSIRFFDGVTMKAKMFNYTSRSDSGVGINAYIDTAWFDMGEPSLLKKATDLRVFSLNNLGQNIQLTYYLDWSTAKTKGPYTMNFSDSSTKTVKRNLDIIQNQSFSFRFQNSTNGQDLNISGYEIVTDIAQAKDKNVK